ncbi:hypothetical protein P691DRAFT_807398 [Macrolepiota fuliginosa MF-IS2]|uniref:Transmembrane protein n=1 Tax=Macrolepiota fuliginosa MF-IS2 TaxID=1400762 RepID=A0A9P5X5H2_9AGAR|nr:hypothetical protein P691DRAFT_807398 [Macrolepiota fuliginosa MF-IS2]
MIVIEGSLWLGLWFVLVPTVAADRVCRKNWRGKEVCRDEEPIGGRIFLAMGIIVCVVAGMLIIVVALVKCTRAAARRTTPNVHHVEESQVQGPPIMRETQYTPGSGPIGVYEPQGESKSALEPTFPRPEPAVFRSDYDYGNPRSAPATKVRFAKSSTLAVPQTAHASVGFPRPLYTGMGLDQGVDRK